MCSSDLAHPHVVFEIGWMIDKTRLTHNDSILLTGSTGRSKWLPSKAAASEMPRRTSQYVEALSDARTKLTDIFSVLQNRSMQETA